MILTIRLFFASPWRVEIFGAFVNLPVSFSVGFVRLGALFEPFSFAYSVLSASSAAFMPLSLSNNDINGEAPVGNPDSSSDRVEGVAVVE